MNANETILAFTEKLKYLALLPAEDIVEIFNFLVESLPRNEKIVIHENSTGYVSVKELLDPLISYYERIWLKQITPQVFSVYLEERRTNNDTERNNRSWNEFMVCHPNLVIFLGNYYIIF